MPDQHTINASMTRAEWNKKHQMHVMNWTEEDWNKHNEWLNKKNWGKHSSGNFLIEFVEFISAIGFIILGLWGLFVSFCL